MSDAAIQIRGVTKRFRDKVAVDSLDLTVPRGSLCGFLGPNGAGKTTTIRMVMSIFYPDEGTISVLDRPTALESKDRIGYLPEERGVYRKMKVGAFLRYIGTLKGVDGHGLDKKIDDWLERLALPGVRTKKCEELSKGMQQKVQIIASLLHEPELVILDEPFSGLDPVNTRLLRELVLDLHAQGRTVIFSTHVLSQAEAMCNRIFLINKGQKLLDGTIGEIRAQFDPKSLQVEFEDESLDAGHLAARPDVRSVTRAGAGFDVHLEPGANPSEVLRHIAGTMPVKRIERRQATLEDIFVSLVEPGDSEDLLRASISAESVVAGGAA